MVAALWVPVLAVLVGVHAGVLAVHAGPTRSQSPGAGAAARDAGGARFSPAAAFAAPSLQLKGAGQAAAARGRTAVPPRVGLMSPPTLPRAMAPPTLPRAAGAACRKRGRATTPSAAAASGRTTMSAAVSVEDAKKASFQEAQQLGMSLGLSLSSRIAQGDTPSQDEQRALEALLSHSDGARGFYVTTLTAPELSNLFEEPIEESMTSAIKASPDPNVKLLTMNIAMSTATELAHLANGNAEFAKASAMTRDRTRALIITLLPDFPVLKSDLANLLATDAASSPASAEVESYRKFLDRWGYDEKMRSAISAQVAPLLA